MINNPTAKHLSSWAALPILAIGLFIGAHTQLAHAEDLLDPAPLPTPTPTPSPAVTTVKVWDTGVAATSGGLSLGLTPGESVDDLTGLTGHGTSFPTIVTLYANSTHPMGPAGLSYWNPDADTFAWYGKTIGYPAGIDLNRAGPREAFTSAKCTPPAGESSLAFGPGDVWVAGQQQEVIYAHVAKTDCFRVYGTDTTGVIDMPRDQAWGLKVDDKTGDVFLAAPQSGRLIRLDAPTADVIIWRVGFHPAYVAVDSKGRPYTTLSDPTADAILRIDPGPDGVFGTTIPSAIPGEDPTTDDIAMYWRVPYANGITPNFRKVPETLETENPNGIIIADAEDNIWFAESNSNEIGRLSGGPDGVLGTPDDVICEFSREGLLNPQQLTVTGTGSSKQVYFSEGAGNSVSILTVAEADAAPPPYRICTNVPPGTFTPGILKATTVFYDDMVEPLRTAITPTVHEVPTSESGGIERLSPMPNPLISADGIFLGDAGNGFPSGITGVYSSLRIAGAYLRGNKHFEVRSDTILPPPPPPPPDPDPAPVLEDCAGRMTGGGKVTNPDGTKVSHGFALRCPCTDGTTDQDDGCGKRQKKHDTLQVNWGNGNKFHLEHVTESWCTDDPTINPGRDDHHDESEAQFDTHSGKGTGRYNGRSGAKVEWKFTDAGEPGTNDHVTLKIIDAAGQQVLLVSGSLQGGNHQAHGAHRHDKD